MVNRRVQINARARHIFLERRADKAFVAQAYALGSRQVHVNKRFAHVGAKQGNVLNHPFATGWRAAAP